MRYLEARARLDVAIMNFFFPRTCRDLDALAAAVRSAVTDFEAAVRRDAVAGLLAHEAVAALEAG